MNSDVQIAVVTAISATAVAFLTSAVTLVSLWIKINASRRSVSQEIEKGSDETKRSVEALASMLNGTATYMIANYPMAAWLKQRREPAKQGDPVRYEMVAMNRHFAELAGKSVEEYRGRTDLEVGVSSFDAQKHYEHDAIVDATGRPHSFVENTRLGDIRFLKYRFSSPDGTKSGIVCLQMSDDSHCDNAAHYGMRTTGGE